MLMCQLKGTVQGFLLWDINDLKSLEKKKQKFDKLITSLYLLLASFQCVSVLFCFFLLFLPTFSNQGLLRK